MFRKSPWRPRHHILQAELPHRLKSWLDVPSSLTARLKAACGPQFNVQVLAERWERPTLEEQLRLDLPRDRLAWVRTVALRCGDSPWVFARTVMPLSSLRGSQRRLLHLGNRPLGTVLFTRPDIRRGPLELRQVEPAELHRWRLEVGDQRLWARRSILEVAGRPLLVMEVFLPALEYGQAYR
jgi:chorismate--pyruvate lyase